MPSRSKQNLSHNIKLTSMPGELIPVLCTEVLPGDVFNHNVTALVRTLPMLAPLMHKVDIRFHTWFIPTRLLWSGFENFITGGPDGNDATVHPTITLPNSGAGGVTHTSLAHYLGVPLGNNADTTGYSVSALPFRAYALIWNTWYRDQNLQTALALSTASGADATTSTVLQNICWEKDYFTSSRPWEQLGSAVTIGLAGNAPVNRVSNAVHQLIYNATSNTLSGGTGLQVDASGRLEKATGGLASIGPNGTWVADLSAVAGVSVNALRRALSFQRFMEHRARFGARYIDYLMSLGIRPQDARLQFPEYLGGGKSVLQISEVLQTAPTTGGATAGVGNLKGHGIGGARASTYRRQFPEHGFCMTLMSVRPKTGYMQSLHKMWSRTTKDDYWQKEYENMGSQAVLNKEIKASHATPTGTFGYQDRYDEYRFIESRVAGEFSNTLDYWHMAQTYASDPALNATFVSCVPTNRVFADTSSTVDKLQIQVRHTLIARRLLSQKSIPSAF